MNNDGDLTPPPVDPSSPAPAVAPTPAVPTWWARYRRFLIQAAALAVVAAAAAAALVLVLKPAAPIEKMVPASANVLVIANVDPSVSQKVNLMRAVHSFPDYKTDKAISDKIDEALKGSGFTFSSDIQPWLGAEVGFSGQLSLDNTRDIPGAFYAVSRDDTKAKAMLAKLRAGTWGKTFQWRDEAYNGFTISVATPKTSGGKQAAYAYVDHVVVIATSSAVIHEVIDTEQGRAARLVDTSDYRATLQGLPSDRVGLVYVNGKSLVDSIKKELSGMAAMSLPSLRNMADLDAFQGIGATLSANRDGLVADLLVKFDQSKLTPATRHALAHAGHPGIVLRWIPKGSEAFLAVANLNRTIQLLLDQAGNDATVKAGTDAAGLTGPGGVLPHLTGDAGLEVELGSNAIPSGAILLGTDDARSVSTFFSKLLAMVGELSTGIGSQGGLATPGAGLDSLGSFTTSTYHGVVITSYRSPQLGALGLLVPSYAVLDGMGILASNVAEVQAVIDVHAGGAAIASDATYQAARGASLSKPSTIVYVNVARMLDAVRQLSAGASAVDTKTFDSLSPIKAFMLTATSQADRAVERFFAVIK